MMEDLVKRSMVITTGWRRHPWPSWLSSFKKYYNSSMYIFNNVSERGHPCFTLIVLEMTLENPCAIQK
jgi:hypothetical protein